MRNEQDKPIADNRYQIKCEKCAAMSPSVHEQSAGISVDRPEQGAQSVVKTNDKNSRADRLQVLRHETHPKFFACADHKNRDEQNDEIAFEPEKISKPTRKAYALLTRRLHSA